MASKMYVLMATLTLKCKQWHTLTLEQREPYGFVVSTVATDALVLKHEAIIIHNAD